MRYHSRLRAARRTPHFLPRWQAALWLALLGFAAFRVSATQEDWPAGDQSLFNSGKAVSADPATAAVVNAALPDAGVVMAGAIAPSPGQPNGALYGRIVFTSGGHGWTWSGSTWYTQRGVTWEMLEDYGNLDQMTMFAYYCFNAGATVVAMRPIGNQTNEVVLDNDDPSVTWSGSWSDSSSSIYYGSPGDVPYRFASVSDAETATATYTPTIPVAGFYPVYTWVLASGNRTNQLYRIRHTGGEATVRVPHHMVGNGWIYLGTYFFNAGSNAANGAVVISNLGPAPGATGSIIADAIRFGNGMGSINRGGGVSGFPREEECARYWVQNSLGQGQASSIYDYADDDGSDSVGTPPRMAAEMNREASGNMFKRVYVGFHSNASGVGTNSTARGCTGLYNNPALSTNVAPNSDTPNQRRLAEIVSTNLNNTLNQITVPPFEVNWANNRSSATYARSDYAFGEINNNYINDEFDATIIEVAFHDNQNDAKLLRDPRVRNWIARACYQAVVRYMNYFDGLPLNFLPEPPYNVRAVATATGIMVSWNTPVAQFGTGTPAGYLVYVSTNGYGFGNPVPVGGAGTTSVQLNTLAPDTDYYFRVAALNAGGESFPSETVGCRRASNPNQSRILFVNAFDRFDRTANLRQPSTRPYVPPGNSGNMERVIPRANNAFDYVVPHGKAINAFGWPFDACSKQAVTNDQVALGNYHIVIWESGQQTNDVINSAAQTRLTAFLNGGGHLFVSGSDIAWSLDRAAGPGAADRAFLNTSLHADLGADANNNSGSYNLTPGVGSIFNGSGSAVFDDGRNGIYWVQNPDKFTVLGAGAVTALTYVGGSGGTAAVQYDGAAGGGRVVYFGFPFETITSASERNAYMADILRFFSQRPDLAISPTSGGLSLHLQGEPGLTYSIHYSADLAGWSWLTNVTVTNGTAFFSDGLSPGVHQKYYRAVLVP